MTQGGVLGSFLIHSGILVRMDAAGTVARGDLLGPGFVAAHGVWLDDAELELLRRAGAALVARDLVALATCEGARALVGRAAQPAA